LNITIIEEIFFQLVGSDRILAESEHSGIFFKQCSFPWTGAWLQFNVFYTGHTVWASSLVQSVVFNFLFKTVKQLGVWLFPECYSITNCILGINWINELQDQLLSWCQDVWVFSCHVQDFMPSLDHVRVVRLLVKHVHSFVYVKTPDLNQLPILHSSDELRRYFIKHFILYCCS